MRTPRALMLASTLALSAWSAAPLAAQEDPGSSSPAAVLNRQVEALSRHDVDAAVAAYADSFRYGPLRDTATPAPSSKSQLREFLRGWWTKNPHSQVTAVQQIVVGPFVAAHERLSGAADGKTYEVLEILEVRHGRVVADWESANVAVLPASVARDANAVGQRAEDAFTRRDPEAAAPAFAEDIPVHVLGDTVTRRETLQTMRDGFHDAVAKNPRLRFSVIDQMVVGPFYVAHERMTGMADRVTRDELDVFEVHDGHVVAEWENVWLETAPTP